jgi:hypothetical protein
MLNEKFTIVAFRYNKKNSVLYESCYQSWRVADLVVKALSELNADVISIRRVYEKNPIETEETTNEDNEGAKECQQKQLKA